MYISIGCQTDKTPGSTCVIKSFKFDAVEKQNRKNTNVTDIFLSLINSSITKISSQSQNMYHQKKKDHKRIERK